MFHRHQNSMPQFSRRGLSGVLAAATVGLMGATRSAASALDSNSDAKLIFRKLRYRGDEGVVFWWLNGTKYGQVGPELKPLFDMHVGAMMRVKNTPDGGYDVTSLEIVFYTDIKTGLFLRDWVNPYTGKTIPVKHSPVGPTLVHHDNKGDKVMPGDVGGSRLESTNVVGPALIIGEDVWIKDDYTAAVFPPDGKSAPFRVNDWSTYLGKVSDITNPAMPFAPASVYLQEATSWQRWMGMGDRQGGLTARAVGRKVARYDEMPGAWRTLVAEVDPEIAKDPMGALDRPQAAFTR